VRIWFDEARYVQRRMWHSTRRFRRDTRGVAMTMDVRGTVEIASWVLGFGNKVQIFEPHHYEALAPKLARGPLSADRESEMG
jgi:predicted DNA-binding transcriptional regulator YafY